MPVIEIWGETWLWIFTTTHQKSLPSPGLLLWLCFWLECHQRGKFFVFLFLFITNMIQIHESNYYTDLICSSCLGKQRPHYYSFFESQLSNFPQKRPTLLEATTQEIVNFCFICAIRIHSILPEIHIFETYNFKSRQTSNFRIQFCNFFLKKNPL